MDRRTSPAASMYSRTFVADQPGDHQNVGGPASGTGVKRARSHRAVRSDDPLAIADESQ
jgi:hypothetical protein